MIRLHRNPFLFGARLLAAIAVSSCCVACGGDTSDAENGKAANDTTCSDRAEAAANAVEELTANLDQNCSTADDCVVVEANENRCFNTCEPVSVSKASAAALEAQLDAIDEANCYGFRHPDDSSAECHQGIAASTGCARVWTSLCDDGTCAANVTEEFR